MSDWIGELRRLEGRVKKLEERPTIRFKEYKPNIALDPRDYEPDDEPAALGGEVNRPPATAATSDPTFTVSENDLKRLSGLLQAICTDGPGCLESNRSFVRFVGDDASTGMCELRIIPKHGHRFICFKRDGRLFVVAHAFRKPGQPATPQAEKSAALACLHQHEARRAMQHASQSTTHRANRR